MLQYQNTPLVWFHASWTIFLSMRSVSANDSTLCLCIGTGSSLLVLHLRSPLMASLLHPNYDLGSCTLGRGWRGKWRTIKPSARFGWCARVYACFHPCKRAFTGQVFIQNMSPRDVFQRKCNWTREKGTFID